MRTPNLRDLAKPLTMRLIGAMALLCLFSASAHAQINPFRGQHEPVLSKADLDTGQQAAGKLLAADGGKVGASEAWVGPTSGNSGSFTVQSAYERKGMTCRSLQSEIDYKSGAKRTWRLNVCRLPSGEWKLM